MPGKEVLGMENIKNILLTPAAVKKIRSMMEQEGKAGYGLRFGVATGGCAGLSYEMSFQKNSYDNDHVIEQEGIKIFVNDESLAFIKGTRIDYVDTLKESGRSEEHTSELQS